MRVMLLNSVEECFGQGPIIEAVANYLVEYYKYHPSKPIYNPIELLDELERLNAPPRRYGRNMSEIVELVEQKLKIETTQQKEEMSNG